MKPSKRKYGLEPRRYGDGGKITLDRVNAEMTKKPAKAQEKLPEKQPQDFVRG